MKDEPEKTGMTVSINILAEPDYTEPIEAFKRLGERHRKRYEQAVFDAVMYGEKKEPCKGCGGKADDPHECPKANAFDDCDDECNCCELCTDNCLMEI